MDFDSLKIYINELKEKLIKLVIALKIDDKKVELDKLENETLQANFWEDNKNSSKILTRDKNIKKIY